MNEENSKIIKRLAAVGIVIATLLLSIAQDFSREVISPEAAVGEAIFVMLAAIILALFFSGFFKTMLKTVAMEMRNIRQSGDPLFDGLDEILTEKRKETPDSYLELIAIINDFYQDTDKVRLVAEENDLERLYHRMDYLEKRLKLTEDIEYYTFTLATALGTSALLVFTAFQSIFRIILWCILLIGGLAAMIFCRVAQKGRDGSYYYMIRRYEIAVLQDVIREVEAGITL